MSDSSNLIDKISNYLKHQEQVYAPIMMDAQAFEDAKSIEVSAAPETSPEPNIEVKPEPKQKPEKPSRNLSKTPDQSLKEILNACKTLEDLKQVCELADDLKTDLPNTNLVFGVGNPNADLLLIGEAPGANEDRLGEPFVGRAGQLLNKILAAIQFKREDVYIANIVKHRPPENRDPLPEERQRSLPYLERQIDIINPKLILCLGRVSAHTLLETSAPLKDMRSKFHPYREKYELMVTYHPASLLRNPNWKRGTWEDVKMLRKRYDDLDCRP